MPTLYLTGFGTSAKLERERIVLSRFDKVTNRKETMEVHLRDVDRAVIAGTPYVSMAVVRKLLKAGVPISFLERNGGWLGGVVPAEHGDASRRLRQYDLVRDPEVRLAAAKAIVARKIGNSRRVLQRLSANREESRLAEQTEVSEELDRLRRESAQAEDMDQLRGYEGMAAAVYFSRLKDFFPEDVPFEYRSRRPPHNGANALLSWGYSIVLGEINSQVRQAGLDPNLGFLHDVSYNRPSLSLDLLEAYRGPLCDLLALKLLNHRVLRTEDFAYEADRGGVYMKREARATFFVDYERTMERLFKYQKDSNHTTFRRCIAHDVMEVVRLIEGKSEIDLFQMP